MTYEKRSQIREGKAKILFETQDTGVILQHFKDDATAFNAQKKGTIVNKGIINNSVSSLLFPFLSSKGIPTHFIQKVSDREMAVKKLTIIPIECVIRNRAAGSICKRLGIEKGLAFNPPLVEFFYKSDELGDPLISESHIFYFKWATPAELLKLTEYTLKVNSALVPFFQELGIDLVDFKLEFGKDEKGDIYLADEFTGDGSRLWDLKTNEPLDKDRFRQDLGKIESAYEDVQARIQNYFEKVK